MKWSFQIGKLFGIPIRMHLTFLLLLFFVGISGSKYGGPTGTLFGMISILLIFLCVVLHEIGHSLMARHYGIVVRDIILLPIGGVSEMEEIPEDPKQEISISIVGPLVSFGLAVIFYILLAVTNQEISFGQLSIFKGNIVANLFWINLVLEYST